MKIYPIKNCWTCPSYDAGNLDRLGNYHGKCTFNEEHEPITEFKNGQGIPSWCPLEDLK